MALHHRLLNLFRRTRISRDIDAELRFHIEERVDELMAEGHSEAGARQLANCQFGNATLYQEKTRNSDIPQRWDLDDATYARSLRVAPPSYGSVSAGAGHRGHDGDLWRGRLAAPSLSGSNRVVRVWEAFVGDPQVLGVILPAFLA
jgi:hypothetical protein